MKKIYIALAAGAVALLSACSGSETKDSAAVQEKPHIEQQVRETDEAVGRALNLATEARERILNAASQQEVDDLVAEWADGFEALGLTQEQEQELGGNQEYIAAERAVREAAEGQRQKLKQ